jgi:methylphosphotriester-DNA--protein-cysteine methyltransferase
MARKPNPKPDDAEQSKRFIETAEQVGADNEEALEKAFKKITGRSPKERQNRS